eukprot:1597205-Amphidinium_carterae.2
MTTSIDAIQWRRKRRKPTLQPDIGLCATPCHKSRLRTTLHHEESDETIARVRIMETVASTFCRRPPCATIFASSPYYVTNMGYQHKAVREAVFQMARRHWKTTFDEAHQWISNYFNSTYSGADEDKGKANGMTSGRTTMRRQRSTMKSIMTRT